MFGVPNRGLRHDALLAMAQGQPNSHFIMDLTEASQYLPELDRAFSRVLVEQPIRILAVYENMESLSNVVCLYPR